MIEKIKISFILLSFSIGCKSIAEISDTSEVNTNPLSLNSISAPKELTINKSFSNIENDFKNDGRS